MCDSCEKTEFGCCIDQENAPTGSTKLKDILTYELMKCRIN